MLAARTVRGRRELLTREALATRTPPYLLVGATAPLVPRYAYASVSLVGATAPRGLLRVRLRVYWSAPRSVVPRYAYASGDGQEQTRFRSPYAPSIRPTGGKYLCAGDTPAGNTASAREYG